MQFRKIILFVTFAAQSIQHQSQTLNDPIYTNYTALPQTSFKNNNGNLYAHFWETNVTAPPIQIGKYAKWINGLYYRNTSLQFNFNNWLWQEKPTNLHDIRYTSILRVQLNKRIELVAVPRLMLRSDFIQPISANDIFTQAVLLGTYAVNGNPNFKIGLGIALNNDFERNAIIPIGSLTYDSKKWKIEMVYPNAHFIYKCNSKLEFGLFSSVDGSISRVNRFTVNGNDAQYFRNFQVLVAPTLSMAIYKQLFMHLKAGITPVRNIEALNQSFESVSSGRYRLNEGLFIRTGISYRLKN
ncbi:MAG: DUF6268 family outer membrane beta-barrel protein [Bacteroidia bacterium]|jgi:hypothetical protein|nr:DUF6268 family outer membrane beta-barrel protein [Bacteroidia bacterium]